MRLASFIIRQDGAIPNAGKDKKPQISLPPFSTIKLCVQNNFVPSSLQCPRILNELYGIRGGCYCGYVQLDCKSCDIGQYKN